jgi:hypothetical protein
MVTRVGRVYLRNLLFAVVVAGLAFAGVSAAQTPNQPDGGKATATVRKGYPAPFKVQWTASCSPPAGTSLTFWSFTVAFSFKYPDHHDAWVSGDIGSPVGQTTDSQYRNVGLYTENGEKRSTVTFSMTLFCAGKEYPIGTPKEFVISKNGDNHSSGKTKPAKHHHKHTR